MEREGERTGLPDSPRMFPENPRKFPDSRTVQTGHPRAPARARARGNLADDLREILAQREAERWILTVRRASEILDVRQLEVANAAWWQGIRWLACRTRPRGSRRCCAAACYRDGLSPAGVMQRDTVGPPSFAGDTRYVPLRRTTSTPPCRRENIPRSARSARSAARSAIVRGVAGRYAGGRLRRARWNRRAEHGQATSRTLGLMSLRLATR